MPDYGTSNQTITEVMRIRNLLERQRNTQNRNKPNQQITTGDELNQYFKAELEAQRQSLIGQKIQKATLYPGIALGTLGRYSRELQLDKKITELANKLSKISGGAGGPAGGAAASESMARAISGIGGLGYMASVGPLNVLRQKRLAYERGLKPQLGAVGTGASALDTLSMANRLMITPRVLSMIYGGGMPSSLQSSMGLYRAGVPMAKHLAGLAGLKLPAAMSSGMGGTMLGMAPFMAAQIGMSMWKQKRINAITAQRKSGGQEEAKFSFSKQLDAQINQLSAKGMLQPGEQINIQLLKWIEAHTSVLPELWAEQQFTREEREKGTIGAGKAYRKSLGFGDNRSIFATMVDKAEGFTSKALARYDIFGQIFNFLSTGKLPKRFQQELEMAYHDFSGKERKQAKTTARERGLSLEQSRLLEISSKRLMDMAGGHDAKMLTILGASFDIQRLMASELLTVRREGFGISDTAIKGPATQESAGNKIKDFLTAPFRAIANVPGLNALLNIARFPVKFTGMAQSGVRGIWGGIKNLLSGGEDVQQLLHSEEALRKKAGIYRSPQQMAYEFVGRGLPDIMEEMRSIGWRQVQELSNIYTVVAMQLQATTGIHHTREEKKFSENVKRGTWSYSAGKYLNEKGIQEQHQQDRERMEIALEKAFKNSLTDRLLWWGEQVRGVARKGTKLAGMIPGTGALTSFLGEQVPEGGRLDKLIGSFSNYINKTRGEAPVLERLTESMEKVSKMEALPFEMLQKAKGKGLGTRFLATLAAAPLTGMGERFPYTPQETIEAALYRERETRGRGRAAMARGWVGAKQERAEMQAQSDVLPRILRSAGLNVGGLASTAGMAGLGMLASIASGGSLLPVMLAAAAGGTAGILPETAAELFQTHKAQAGVSYQKMKEAAQAYRTEMPAFMAGKENQRTIRRQMLKSYGKDFFQKIGAHKKEFFEKVSNMPYAILASQNVGPSEFEQAPENIAQQFKSISKVKTISDLYHLFSKDDQPYARVIIAGIENKLNPSGFLPITPATPASPSSQMPFPKKGKADEFVDLNPFENLKRRFKLAGTPKEVLQSEELRELRGRLLKSGDRRLYSNIYNYIRKLSDEEMNVGYGSVKKVVGGTISTAIGGGGPSDRTLKQELGEVSKEKEKAKIISFQKKMVELAEEIAKHTQDIDDNTEEVDSSGRGKRTGKLKRAALAAINAAGGIKSLFSILVPALLAGGLIGGPMGAAGMAGGALMLGTRTGRSLLWKGTKLAGKGLWKGAKWLGGKGLSLFRGAGEAGEAAGEVTGAAGEATGGMGEVLSMFGKGGGAAAEAAGEAAEIAGGVGGRFFLPVTIIMGAIDTITDLIKGWKAGGVSGALKQIFLGNKKGGITSAFKGMGKYGLIGAGIGMVGGPVGAVAGSLIGSAIGGIVGFLGQDRMAKFYDFFKKWTGADLIASQMPGKYGKKLAEEYAIFPVVGPIIGGITGSIFDIFSYIFSGKIFTDIKNMTIKKVEGWFGIGTNQKNKTEVEKAENNPTSPYGMGVWGLDTPTINSNAKKTKDELNKGPLNNNRYNPTEVKTELAKKVEKHQEDRKRKEELETYSKPTAPQVIPIPIPTGKNNNETDVVRNKSTTMIDEGLDSFVNGMFKDSAHEFSQRYKNYAYHSNIAHSFQ